MIYLCAEVFVKCIFEEFLPGSDRLIECVRFGFQ